MSNHLGEEAHQAATNYYSDKRPPQQINTTSSISSLNSSTSSSQFNSTTGMSNDNTRKLVIEPSPHWFPSSLNTLNSTTTYPKTFSPTYIPSIAPVYDWTPSTDSTPNSAISNSSNSFIKQQQQELNLQPNSTKSTNFNNKQSNLTHSAPLLPIISSNISTSSSISTSNKRPSVVTQINSAPVSLDYPIPVS